MPAPASTAATGKQDEADRLVNGGLGNLDVAWLNNRIGKGGLEKEEEILREARELLEKVVRKEKEEKDEEMEDA